MVSYIFFTFSLSYIVQYCNSAWYNQKWQLPLRGGVGSYDAIYLTKYRSTIAWWRFFIKVMGLRKHIQFGNLNQKK